MTEQVETVKAGKLLFDHGVRTGGGR
jgi:hypothetical protein